MKIPPSGLGLYICKYFMETSKGDIYETHKRERISSLGDWRSINIGFRKRTVKKRRVKMSYNVCYIDDKILPFNSGIIDSTVIIPQNQLLGFAAYEEWEDFEVKKFLNWTIKKTTI